MKKYLPSLITFAVSVVLALILVACSGEDLPDEYQVVLPSISEDEELDGTGAESTEPPQTDPGAGGWQSGVLRDICLDKTRYYPKNAGTAPNGFYHIEAANNLKEGDLAPGMLSPAHIWYTDYATRQKKLLCSAAGYAHNSEECTAWLPHIRYIIFAAGGGVVAADLGYKITDGDEINPQMVGRHASSIIVMDYNGENRRELVQFPNEEFERTWFTDDEYIYGIRTAETTEDSGNVYGKIRTFLKLDLKTGEVIDTSQIDILDEFFVGVLGREIVFFMYNYDDLQEGQTEDWRLTASITALNTETMQTRVTETDCNGWSYIIDDGWLYYSENTAEKASDEEPGWIPSKLMRLNLETWVLEEFFSSLDNGVNEIVRIIDGKVIVRTNNAEEKYFCVPTQGGEATELGLFIKTNIADETYKEPVIPLAETGEYFFVVSDYFMDEDSASRSPAYSLRSVYSLILKEDYWAGISNFIPITVVN